MKDAIENLNELFNSDILDVKRLNEYKVELEVKIQNADKELSKGGKLQSEISKVEKKIDGARQTIEKLNSDFKSFEKQKAQHNVKLSELKKCADKYVEKITLLEHAKVYLETLNEIKSISQALSERPTKTLYEYTALCKKWESLQMTQAVHLKKYLEETVLYWHSILKDKLTKEYEECLQKFKWPFLTANVPPAPSADLLARFQSLTSSLLEIGLPPKFPKPDDEDYNAYNVTITLPTEIIIRPLKKRFLYHFSGTRKTNQIDKPEWYFTRILSWIKDHQDFVEKHLQPVYDTMENPIDARVEFMSGLVQLAVDKLHWDLPHIQYDDFLFSHTLDEALGFARELIDGFGYPENDLEIFRLITRSIFLTKWVSLERKYSTEKLDTIMSSDRAFEKTVNIEDDAEITTECVEKFITLLTAITDRYQSLPQPGHRIQFLELQLELLDDFRVRLCQLLKDQNSEVPVTGILNSISCLISVIEEWTNMPHFLLLQFFQGQMKGNSEEGVFEKVIDLFKNMQEELINNFVETIIYEVKAESRGYRKDIWHAMEDGDERVTPSSVPIFLKLTKSLSDVNQNLTPRLRTVVLHRIAKSLDIFLFEDFAMLLKFSPSGGRRLEKDFKFGIVPLFSQYLSNPEVHFPLLSDVCVLLNYPQRPAKMLLQSLKSSLEENEFSKKIIHDANVKTLELSQVRQILRNRIDLID